MSVSTAPETDREVTTSELISPDIPWELIVWNDPVNLMSYVSYVFQSYFGYSEAKAAKLMMQVHTEGNAQDQGEQHLFGQAPVSTAGLCQAQQ